MRDDLLREVDEAIDDAVRWWGGGHTGLSEEDTERLADALKVVARAAVELGYEHGRAAAEARR